MKCFQILERSKISGKINPIKNNKGEVILHDYVGALDAVECLNNIYGFEYFIQCVKTLYVVIADNFGKPVPGFVWAVSGYSYLDLPNEVHYVNAAGKVCIEQLNIRNHKQADLVNLVRRIRNFEATETEWLTLPFLNLFDIDVIRGYYRERNSDDLRISYVLDKILDHDCTI